MTRTKVDLTTRSLTLFPVTDEKSGGVIVSTPERIVLTAARSTVDSDHWEGHSSKAARTAGFCSNGKDTMISSQREMEGSCLIKICLDQQLIDRD